MGLRRAGEPRVEFNLVDDDEWWLGELAPSLLSLLPERRMGGARFSPDMSSGIEYTYPCCKPPWIDTMLRLISTASPIWSFIYFLTAVLISSMRVSFSASSSCSKRL